MTVSTSYSALLFNGNSSTTAFAVSWPFFTGSLVVTAIDAAGARTTKTIATHYTVSGGTSSTGLPATGTVTMLTAPATGTQLEITRATPITQSSVWNDNAAFPAKTIESQLDRRTLIEQELEYNSTDNLIDFTLTEGTITTGAAGSSVIATVTGDYPDFELNLTIPRGATGASGAGTGDVIGPASATANAIVLFDGTSGTSIKDSTYTITAAGAALLDDAAASNQRTTLGLGALATLATVGTSQIDADAVTYAKIQNISAQYRLLGRKTPAAGDTEECTLSEVLDFIGSAAQGDILFRGAAGWQRLGAGTAGQNLQSGGAGADVSWATAANTGWEKIGTTTIGAAVASVTHSWSAAAYTQVLVQFSDLSQSAGSQALIVYLMTASGGSAIVTTTSYQVSGALMTTSAAGFMTGHVLFDIGTDAATKRSTGFGIVSESGGTTGTMGVAHLEPATGGNATDAKAVTLAFNSGNIDDGVVTVYGLKA